MPAKLVRRGIMDTSPVDEQPTRQRRVSPVWAAAGAVGLVVLLLLAYSIATGPGTALQVGQPAPTFKLTALTGEKMDLEAQRGQVVVVNFFASWCNPCRQEAADLEAIWRQYEPEGVQFFGIAYKDARSMVEAFLTEFDVTYSCAVDPGNRTSRAYGVTGVPETFVVNGQGLLLRHFIGPVSQAELGLTIEQARGQ
jgi:cytochrome c biogenesis protein CcmG/thiol:disulfide interchange protein DsbE